jgi:hypothetical protein
MWKKKQIFILIEQMFRFCLPALHPKPPLTNEGFNVHNGS